uniref:Erbin n=1 Tax=Erpetoichthys calabaricus TaxID=27687 RepID=A0A8C4SBP6_ERPCA
MTTKRNLFVRLVPCRCLRGEEEIITKLDYSHCSLEQVPKEIFTFEKTLEELYLDANQIEELPKQLFNCQALHKLSLPDNDLTVLPASIANLINLRELDVSKNGIQEFPENIKNCKVLTIVEASVNPISKLPDGFTQLLSLSQLYLNDAFLEFLPANFGRLTKLQILELRENQLKMLPKTMNKLTQLERLDLGSNEFTEVPEVIEQLTGLKEFWMDGNRLTFVPGIIGSLKQLTYLDLSKNNIEMIDDQLAGCESLQDLLLSNNALQQLPGSVGSLKKLSALKIDENQIMYLPETIGGLTSLEELDCSFNEIEALPSSIGHFTSLRTFAADHNFLTQLPPEVGNWKNATVLFLHSNKLESLPEEMGEMQKLKVINLSDNRLKNLPFSFTKLNQLTAMWLSENQSKPLIPLQKEEDEETGKTVLTNYMFPQQPRTEEYLAASDNESFNPSLWEEQRKQRAQVAFECDEDKDERETPPREGNLKRYPTPYPEELKSMVKTAQNIAHRLKEDESSDDSGKEIKQIGDELFTVKDAGVKTLEHNCINQKPLEPDPIVTVNCIRKPAQDDSNDTKDTSANERVKVCENSRAIINHEDTLEDSEDLSSDEDEMRIAEMRPPLIEISINQPKVVALSKDKKDDSKDVDSLLEDTAVNSNQNNSNCSSPSRMSDSVSLTTDSSQDISLSTPEKETKFMIINKIRFWLYGRRKASFHEREIDLKNGVEDPYSKLDQINQNVSIHSSDHLGKFDGVGNNTVTVQEVFTNTVLLNNNIKDVAEYLENGNSIPKQIPNQVNGRLEETTRFPLKTDPVRTSEVGVLASIDMSLSKSTEELSPQKHGSMGPVVKSQSVTNIETGELKIYSNISDSGPQQSTAPNSVPIPNIQGQCIVRSKSASLLDDQPLQVFPGSSCSSSDLISANKILTKYDGGFNTQNAQTCKGNTSNLHFTGTPQYNIQYTSSTVPKDGLWTQRMVVPFEQGNLAPTRLQRSDSTDSYTKHIVNTNYSNRNAQGSLTYTLQQRGNSRPVDMWGAPVQKDRLVSSGPRSTLQRQSSTSSSASVSMGEVNHPRRIPVNHGLQRPLSARTYSIDGPNVPRPQSARPSVHEVPERTMSVSDFNYSRTSPSKRMVPPDWRDQVLRHIEARNWRRYNMLSRSFNSNYVPVSTFNFGSYRDLHGSQGSIAFSSADRRHFGADMFCVPLSNGQMCPASRSQINSSQVHCPPQQGTVVRHPSREQLIDYLMLKVNQPPQYNQSQGPTRSPHECVQQEVHVKLEKNPELGFSISGGIGGRGNPFRPDDTGIFVTRVQPEGPASKLLQPGDKIIKANGYSFVNIDHGYAVSLLKTFQTTVDLVILREVPA